MQPTAPTKGLLPKVRIMMCDENKPKQQKMVIVDRGLGTEGLLKQAKNKLNAKKKFKSTYLFATKEPLLNLEAIADGTVVAVSYDATSGTQGVSVALETTDSPLPAKVTDTREAAPTVSDAEGGDSGGQVEAGDVTNDAEKELGYCVMWEPCQMREL